MNSRSKTRAVSEPALPRRTLTPRVWLRIQVGLAAALSVGLILSALAFSDLFDPIQVYLANWVYLSHPPSKNVVVIAIDDKSIAELGAWPWPRTFDALLLERLKTAPPRVIAFDVPFTQPTNEDTLFANRIQDAGNVILSTTGVKAAALPMRPGTFPQYDVVIPPDQPLSQNAVAIGHKMLFADGDGVLRRVPVAIESNGERYFALGILAAAQYTKSDLPTMDWTRVKFTLGKKSISTDEYGRVLINYAGGPNTIPTFSFADVMRGRVSPEVFRDKLVMIGLVGESETEIYATPLNASQENEPNVDVEAQIADMWVSNPPRTLEPPDRLALIAIILVMALLSGLTMPHLRPLSAAALAAIYLVGYFLYGFDLFSNGILPNLLFPPLALFLTFAAVVVFRYVTEERRRDSLISLFRRYLSKDSAARVVDGIERGQIELTGAQRTVTLLYADFRGLGELVENASASTVINVAGEYLNVTTRAILGEGGAVTKPLGDSLVAMWNAPLEQPDHAACALRAAMEIRRAINALKKEHKDSSPISISIGITTGPAVIGNLKTAGQPEYTLIGSVVDTAARISAFAGPQQILIDQATASLAPKDIELRELSPVRVRGRKEPLPIWEVRKTGEVVMNDEEEEKYKIIP